MYLKEIAANLINGNAAKVRELTQLAINQGIAPQDILDQGLIAGMDIVGRKFKANEIYIPEVLVAAKAMYAGMDILKPLFVETGVKYVGKLVIGTVRGDLHDIGKNLVSVMMEGAGFEVIDLGVDVSPEKFVAAVKEHNPKIVGMSALLTTTMLSMKDTIEALEHENLRDKVIIMIGGAPVTQSYADEIGADGYADDARSAIEKAKELLGIE
ncbi:MAG TPA: cobalamin-binding protein [bacterium (Candidatus Stahlbacteria)]|nr:cobalamin-binding protein [Candidatus Stahlbacteria bacterium]